MRVKNQFSDHHKVIEVIQVETTGKTVSSPRLKLKKSFLMSVIEFNDSVAVSFFEFDEFQRQISTDVALVISQSSTDVLLPIKENPYEEELDQSLNSPIVRSEKEKQTLENSTKAELSPPTANSGHEKRVSANLM